MSYLEFLKTYFQDYKVGAFFPSSRYAVRKVAAALRPGAQYIVEYGAGDGVLTRALLDRVSHDGAIVALETNQAFVPALAGIGDSRLIVKTDDVRDILADPSSLGLPRIDAVVSGIPFSFFKPHERKDIIARTASALAPGGQFIVYQYSPLVAPHLRRHFDSLSFGYEPRNVFPYFVMNAKKGE